MEDPRHDPDAGNDRGPRAPETVAGAFAPPSGSGGSVVVFLSALVAVVCGVAGVLLLFTDQPAWYGAFTLAVAGAAAVVLAGALRRGRR